ncbi:5'-nucleotidase C-terminal domain-containing protein [uncultured Paraglaciecola sp.]|uniref:bifunctional metallophosphatase/5'-nucleotidase n=1 Tax=uncultured Paraglaciecola sp. TaxID=1765024 RepID=UPI0025EE51A9|nr:5'-nucleotidase C-terminal domain-containing protein [uncultured Paraglaciecola sp.]
MAKSFRLLIVLHALLLSTLLSASSTTEKQLTLVFAGNMPDIGVHTYGTYAGLAGLLEEMRRQDTPTIFTFAGGSLGPSPLSSLDRGSHIIDILNTLEPDLMTLTKREFSYFEDELTLRSYEAAFPIVSSNLYDPMIRGNLEGILSSLLVEKDNTKVGFISILDEEVVEEYLLKRVNVFEPRQVIQDHIAALKKQGAELVVLVYSKERDYYQTLITEKQIDFALRVRPTGQISIDQLQQNKVYSISYKEPFMLLKMNWNTNNQVKNLTIDTPKIYYSNLPSIPTTSLLVDEYNQRLNRLLDQKIGFFGTEIHTTRSLVRTKEMPFGNFIADALKDYAKTDVGLVNGGIIRGDKSYTKGAIISRRDIATELPFRAHVAVLTLTGAQLKQALENSVSEVENAKGKFLHVSGIFFTYSLEEPAGNRIKTLLVNGKELKPQQDYTVATSDYLANGGDGYEVFVNALHNDKFTQISPLLSDIVIRVIQQQKTIFPKIESRIKQVTQ